MSDIRRASSSRQTYSSAACYRQNQNDDVMGLFSVVHHLHRHSRRDQYSMVPHGFHRYSLRLHRRTLEDPRPCRGSRFRFGVSDAAAVVDVAVDACVSPLASAVDVRGGDVASFGSHEDDVPYPTRTLQDSGQVIRDLLMVVDAASTSMMTVSTPHRSCTTVPTAKTLRMRPWRHY